jgi:hypothetical protein
MENFIDINDLSLLNDTQKNLSIQEQIDLIRKKKLKLLTHSQQNLYYKIMQYIQFTKLCKKNLKKRYQQWNELYNLVLSIDTSIHDISNENLNNYLSKLYIVKTIVLDL